MISIRSVTDLKVSFPEGVNNAINKEIEEHVEKMQESKAFYAKKRNTSPEKAQEDMFLGKKAEFFAVQALVGEYKFPLVKPDLNIYTRAQKGWSPDLPFNKANKDYPDAHVKSCSGKTYDMCNDYSWTWNFKNNDNDYGKDDLFKNFKSHDLIVLVFIDKPQNNEAVIKAILPWRIASTYLADPIKFKLLGLKKCLYCKTLVANKENIVSI